MDALVTDGPFPRLTKLRGKRVVVLPDLYVDALAPMPAWPQASADLGRIAQRGGGNLPVGPIHVKLGGNAANLAVALARLGAQTSLIAQTDAIGRLLLERTAAGSRLDTDLVRVGAKASTTIALECPGANVMLSHAGPLTDFGPECLTRADWARMQEADAVAVVNWSQNKRGSQLLAAIAKRLAPSGTFIAFDSGDPRHRGSEARSLVTSRTAKAWWPMVGAVSVNENELAAFTGDETVGDGGSPAQAVACAQGLARELGTRVDLHARRYAASVTPDGAAPVTVKGLPGAAKRLTGAGDAWNAGNLAGYLLGAPAADRLALAHKVATLYVTGTDGLPPTAKQLDAPAQVRSRPRARAKAGTEGSALVAAVDA